MILTPTHFPHLGCFQLKGFLQPVAISLQQALLPRSHSGRDGELQLSPQIRQDFAVCAAQSSGPVHAEHVKCFVTVQPWQPGVPEVLTLQQFCMQWLVSKRWHNRWEAGEPRWWLWSATEERSFSPKEMCDSPEVNLQAVLSLSPERGQAGQRDSRMAIYKRAWSTEAEKSRGKKGSFTSFTWFLVEMRLRRLHSLSAHLWFSVSLPSLPLPSSHSFIPGPISPRSQEEGRHPISVFSQSRPQMRGTTRSVLCKSMMPPTLSRCHGTHLFLHHCLLAEG